MIRDINKSNLNGFKITVESEDVKEAICEGIDQLTDEGFFVSDAAISIEEEFDPENHPHSIYRVHILIVDEN